MAFLEEGIACARTWRWGEHVVTIVWSYIRVTGSEAQLKGSLCTSVGCGSELSLSALWEEARKGGFRFQGISLTSFH